MLTVRLVAKGGFFADYLGIRHGFGFISHALDFVHMHRLRRLPCLVAALLGIALWVPQPAWAVTAAGTSITNFMTVNYQDASSNNYNTISNTVTTLVANVPLLTITAPVGQSVTIGMIVVDTFTLTNTGNGSGTFQIPAAPTFAGTSSGTTLVGYVLSSGPCAVATPCTLATLETQTAALSATSAGGTLSLGVEYSVSGSTANVAVGQTVQTTLTANILYPTAGSVAQAISTNASGTSTDTVVPDARLDIAASASQPTSGSLNITWTITANNGGGFTASDSAAVKTLLSGSTPGGIAVVAQVPTYSGTALALQGTPTCTLNGASSGATATLYYTVTTATPSAGNWGTTSTGGTTAWLACYIHGGASGAELPSAPTGSTGAGSVTTPQVTLTFVTLPPGSSTLGIVTNIANGWANGAVWATGAYPVIGPGITLGTADGTGVALNTATTEGNTTAGTGTLAPGAASNVSASQAYVAPTGSTTTGTAVYVGADTTTLGAWHAASTPWTPYVYGSDGYTILDGTTGNATLGTHNPSYATVTLVGNFVPSAYAASGTTDTRAPYQTSTSSTRIAGVDACWNQCAPAGGLPFTIDVNITDGNTHQFSLYLLAFDTGTLQDAILVTDVTHGTNLLMQGFSDFNNAPLPTEGQGSSGPSLPAATGPLYARWNISGHVRFTIYYSGGSDASVFSAYFFDPVTRSAVTSSSSASYVATDTLTQGNWTPGSGSDGYLMASGNSRPSYESEMWYGYNSSTWASSTADVRAPYTTASTSSTRSATQTFSSYTLGVEILLAPGTTHTVDFYSLDWASTALMQTIYVADATTGAIYNTQTLTGFHNGTHTVWNMQGNIFFFLVSPIIGGPATLSGIYFGVRKPVDTLVNTVSPTGNQPPGTNLVYTTTFTNSGVMASLGNHIMNPVPANTYFMVGSATSSIATTGLTVAIAYSNNGGGSYAYTPVSGGGGAPSGYDRTVTNVQWTFTGSLSQGTGANTGTVGMTVMIQ